MTEVSVSQGPDRLPHDAIIICPYFKDDDLSDVPAVIQTGGTPLQSLLRDGHARGRRYETAFVPPSGQGPGVLLVGAEGRDSLSPYYLMRVVAAGSRFLSGRGYFRAAVADRGAGTPHDFGRAAAEGIIRGTYNPGLKKTADRQERRIDEAALLSSRDRHQIEEGARVGRAVGEASAIARDLVNRPPNDLTPSSFASTAQQLAGANGIEAEILDEEAMRQKGMGSLLGVAAGSRQPPRLIILRCGKRDAAVRLALVGKGLTFDSGGLSIKTAEGMETMKGDMGGGAAVVSGIVAVSQLGLQNIQVTGYVGATENMPGGEAMRPGDVLTAMNGETIEVLNTDAEGRLVLADVLSLAVREGSTHIVDFATLTGGAVVALGHACSLATGKPGDWVDRVVHAADDGLERAWSMPLFPEYRQAMDSEVADIKNTGGRPASALTAASFLSDFVDGVPWTHVDIAGTAWNDKATPFMPVGGTGEGVGTIVSLVRELDAGSG